MEWINVKERLPEDNLGNPIAKRVLIYTETFGIVLGFLDNGKWRKDYRSVIDDNVLLWAEIPKIPEEIRLEIIERNKEKDLDLFYE